MITRKMATRWILAALACGTGLLLPACASVNSLQPRAAATDPVLSTPSQGLGDSLGANLHSSLVPNDLLRLVTRDNISALQPSYAGPLLAPTPTSALAQDQ